MSESPSKVRSSPLPDVLPLNALQDAYIRLEQAEQLRQQGKLDRAQRLCESLTRQYPDYMGALHTLGLIYADRGNFERALDYLVRAAMRNPRSWTTLTALSGVYLRLDASEMAAQALEQARAINPHDPAILVTLGEIYREEREYELGEQIFRQALELEPDLTAAALGLLRVYSSLGQYTEAAKVIEGLIARGIRDSDLILALASMPISIAGFDALSELDHVTKHPGDTAAEFESSVAFARAAVLDRLQRHSEAWQYLVPANKAQFAALRKEWQETSDRQRVTLRKLRESPGRTARDSDGVKTISLFILGSSRSGKTTMEKLVATLDGVKRGYENPIVENAIGLAFDSSSLLRSNYFEHLPAQLDSLCRTNYLEELSRRAGSAKVFTNTLPGRISDVARVVNVFPNARVIFVKRNLEDTLLRVYLRRYNKGNAYSYDLKAARDYILWYHQMIDLMAEKFPDITRVVHYEDMIADPAAVVRVAADLCSLPMHDRPLPPIGDDRGCAAPYRQLMAAELAV